MEYCTECGNQLKETTKFCSKCGTPVAEMEAKVAGEDGEQPVQPTVTPQTEQTDTTSDRQQGEPTPQASQVAEEDDVVKEYALGYLTYWKDTFIKPTIGFTGQVDWIHGAINIGLYTILLGWFVSAMNPTETFFNGLISTIISVAVMLGILYGLSTVVLLNRTSIYDFIASYGSMLTLQLALLLIATLAGPQEGFGALLIMVFAINQLNIFNLYLFKKAKDRKLDRYYQVLGAYVVLWVASIIVVNILN